MTDIVKVALIVSIAPTLASIASLAVAVKALFSLWSYKLQINHRMDELLMAHGGEQRAEGKAEGIEQERTR